VDIGYDQQVNMSLKDEDIACSVTDSRPKEKGVKESDEPELFPVNKQQTRKAVFILRKVLEEGSATNCDYRLLYSLKTLSIGSW
jgi:hypothetical protein